MVNLKVLDEMLGQVITASMEGLNAKDLDFNCSDVVDETEHLLSTQANTERLMSSISALNGNVVDDEYLNTLADEANTELWENGTLGRSLEHARVVEFKGPATHE